MKFTDLFIGQRIQATQDSPEDTGTIVHLHKSVNRVTIKWDLETHYWKNVCAAEATFKEWIPATEKPKLTKEEIIQARIKKLWNESNWVKINPERAY